MRLDEWQKFIESQFLDDAELASEEASSVALQQQIDFEPETAMGGEDVGAPEVALLELSAFEDLSLSIPEADEEPVETYGITVESVIVAPQTFPKLPADPPRAIDFGSMTEFDMEVPSFDRYFPPARILSSDRKQVEPAAPASQEVASAELPTVNIYANAPAQEATPAAALSVENETGATESVPDRARRVPRTRARHARNVRPENVPSGLSAADLWSTVPKHVKTLLALERMEEEKEIAQFSYKRPFSEKRQELIERLLDPILTLEETARLLNVCPTTVRRYTNKGILTYYRKETERSSKTNESAEKETRQRRFRLSDILAFLETQQAAIEADRLAEAKRAQRTAGTPDAESP